MWRCDMRCDGTRARARVSASLSITRARVTGSPPLSRPHRPAVSSKPATRQHGETRRDIIIIWCVTAEPLCGVASKYWQSSDNRDTKKIKEWRSDFQAVVGANYLEISVLTWIGQVCLEPNENRTEITISWYTNIHVTWKLSDRNKQDRLNMGCAKINWGVLRRCFVDLILYLSGKYRYQSCYGR